MKGTYIKRFKIKDKAQDWMSMKNRTTVKGPLYVLVDGPGNDFAVVDLKTAVELNALYELN